MENYLDSFEKEIKKEFSAKLIAFKRPMDENQLSKAVAE
jgi:hypothetical protein